MSKSLIHKSESIAGIASQKGNNTKSNIQFSDRRSEAISQQGFQEMANESPQNKKVKQLKTLANYSSTQQKLPVQKKENLTGLPDNLKTGIENLSGYSMDDVKVHYNSDKPVQLQAHAYAQGSDIHLASGQEKYLPHEAWHVVQQKQGKVKSTLQMKGNVNINDDEGLEKEADIMGNTAKSLSEATYQKKEASQSSLINQSLRGMHSPIQRMFRRTAAVFTKKPTIIPKVGTGGSASSGGAILVPPPGVTGSSSGHLASTRKSPASSTVLAGSSSGLSHHSSTDAEGQDSLLQTDLTKMIQQVITHARRFPNELNSIMDSDKTRTNSVDEMAPVEQFQKCLTECQGLPQEQVAIYLYTTYYYKPLNRYLRNDPNFAVSSDVQKKLLRFVSHFLVTAFAGTTGQTFTSKFRLELNPSWIGEKRVGDSIPFPGITSTHPNLKGVNSMWPDIERGFFGPYEDKLAMLVFQGRSKVIRPGRKYFLNEIEDLLPPGMVATIINKYETNWKDPHTEYIWTVDVYHLMIVPAVGTPATTEFRFNTSGSLEPAHGQRSVGHQQGLPDQK